MKRLIFILLFLAGMFIWYVESRSFTCENDKCVTVWKTLNNTCYVFPYKYYSLFKPSKQENFIKTTNISLGFDFIWKDKSDTILVELDQDGQIFNGNKKKRYLIDYKLNEKYNDSLYTYFDNKLHIRRYKKNVKRIDVSIDDMGAL